MASHRAQAVVTYRVACAAMLAFGVVLGLPGTIVGLPDVAAQFDLNLAERGALISSLFVGMLAGCIAGGPLVDAMGHQRALAASTGVAGLAMVVFALSSSLPAVAATLALAGIGCSGMNISANALASNLFPAERARRMNGIGVMAGIGGLTMPAAAAVLASSVSWRTIVLVAASYAMAVALVAARLRGAAGHRTGSHDAMATISQPGFLTVGLLVLLGASNENTMAGWTSTYLQAEGLGAGTATAVLASHWLGLIVGRAMVASRVEHDKAGGIFACAVAGGAIAAAWVALPIPAVLMSAPFASGLAIGIIVPTALALGGERLSGNAGLLFGLLLTLAQLAGIVTPAVVGAIAQGATLRAGLSVMLVTSLAIAVLARLLRQQKR